METKRIWFDCDGVILDWTKPFLKFSGLAARGVQYKNIFDIDLTKLYQNPDDFFEVMYRYQSETFCNLPALVSIGEFEMLRNFGYEIHVVTQIENNPVARMNRVGNLTKHFGAIFKQIHFTERGQCKLDYIESLYPTEKVLIVEDHPKLLRTVSDRIEGDLIDRGRTQLLAYGVVHPYNEAALLDIPNIIRVPNTHDAIASVLIASCG